MNKGEDHMRQFLVKSKNCCNHKQEWIDDERGVLSLAREANQDTPLERYAGIAWDDENECWQRELTQDEELDIALKTNHFGDYIVKEIKEG
jgi:hypothetical protein